MYGDKFLEIYREAIVARYSYLPFWYTLFYRASVDGAPTMRPMWVEFPEDAETFTLDQQWMVGNALLVGRPTLPSAFSCHTRPITGRTRHRSWSQLSVRLLPHHWALV